VEGAGSFLRVWWMVFFASRDIMMIAMIVSTVVLAGAAPHMNPDVRYMVSNPNPSAGSNFSYTFHGKYFE
jgi:hypothetical protein